MNRTADAIVCGAGIVGIACAWHLAARFGVRRVAIVDERPPLSLTSDKSTECYRNWWPGPGDAMVALMNRSVDLLEELAESSGNRFHLNRRGYLFATADPERVAAFEAAGREAELLGAGALRRHDGRGGGGDYVPHRTHGYTDMPDGADLIADPTLIQHHFPWLSTETVAVLHARRCGWLSAQQLGMYLLEEARRHGAFLVSGQVEEVLSAGGRVAGARIALRDGGSERITAPVFVNAAGPFAKEVAAWLGADLPVWFERHVKMSFADRERAVPRDTPLFIWADPIRLPWSAEEREALAEDPEGRALLEPFPAGAHGRPDGGPDADTLILYWTYEEEQRSKPEFPIDWDPGIPRSCSAGCRACCPPWNATSAACRGPSSTAATTPAPARTAPSSGPSPSKARSSARHSRGSGSWARARGASFSPPTSRVGRSPRGRMRSRSRATTIRPTGTSSTTGPTTASYERARGVDLPLATECGTENNGGGFRGLGGSC